MRKLLVLLLVPLLTACHLQATTPPASTPSIPSTSIPQPTLPVLSTDASPILISEVMAGKQGNNNFEFIELYNRSSQAADLKGWALWYRLPTSQEDLFVYRWNATTLVAPRGHYLLVLEGSDIGLQPDAAYSQPLNITGGGLQLRQTDGAVRDRLGWGKAPQDYYYGKSSPALQNGQSLERKPGGEAGNFQESADNSQDFSILTQPSPQNSSSPLTPLPAYRLEVSLLAPQVAAPGDTFDYTLKVLNLTGDDLQDVLVTFPMPVELAVPSVPKDITLETSGSPAVPTAKWNVGALAKGEEQTATIQVVVPYTYFTALARNYSASASNWPENAYGGLVQTRISGGVIPIGTARTLLNSEMTVEGIATMYTGGYYAGTGNNKFYLQDETGGIQVQVFGGQGSVNVDIGDRVRVRGEVSVYRGSVQIVPITVPDDVQVIEKAASEPAWIETAVPEALTETSALHGQLVQVQGDITRVDEFSYSYEIDLLDAERQSPLPLTLYVDKQAGINVEEFVPGQQLTAIGILDLRDTKPLLYPRRQADLEQRYPPILRIVANAPHNIQAGELFTVTLSVYNHLPEPATPVTISAEVPASTELATVLDGGCEAGGKLQWELPSIPADGSIDVHYQLKAQDPGSELDNLIQIALYEATAPQAKNPAIGQPFFTFIGEGVPIWAIQGPQARSPYLGSFLTTTGVVTGIFPELGGFFIQETTTDENESTSAGIFILTPTSNNEDFVKLFGDLAIGNAVQVNGKVREPSQQTVIEVFGQQAVTLVASTASLPLPIALDLPTSQAEALVYYESLEGMLVTIAGDALAVSPISKYGETVVILPKHRRERIFQGEENGIMIMVDDGSSVTYTDGTQLPYLVSTGDRLSGLTGPLAYTYGRFKIEPVTPPVIMASATIQPQITPAAADEFTLMTWNVENLFDPLAPHPTDPPLPSPSEYRVHLEKVAHTIETAGFPIIIGLQEVENIRVLNDLAAHPVLSAYKYQAVLIEGNDSRGIDVGFLVRTDRATVLDVEAYPAPDGLFSRPPLVLHAEVQTATGTAQLYVLNNHFTSMSEGEEATEPRRTAQAKWNVTLLEEILAEDPQAWIAVIGDLNSYFISAPIQALRDGGLVHVFDTIPPEERYTYIYEGESEVLDHILLNPALMSALRRVEVLHVNADYPLSAPDDTSPRHKSDHDPVIVAFTIN